MARSNLTASAQKTRALCGECGHEANIHTGALGKKHRACKNVKKKGHWVAQ